MSKMGQELDRKLEENKHEMYEMCREILDCLRIDDELQYGSDVYYRLEELIAKIEGK